METGDFTCIIIIYIYIYVYIHSIKLLKATFTNYYLVIIIYFYNKVEMIVILLRYQRNCQQL